MNRLKLGKIKKGEGNQKFSEKKFEEAISLYVEGLVSLNGIEGTEANDLEVTLTLNLISVFIKLKQPQIVILICDEVQKFCATNWFFFYNKGIAYKALGLFSEAEECFKISLDLTNAKKCKDLILLEIKEETKIVKVIEKTKFWFTDIENGLGVAFWTEGKKLLYIGGVKDCALHGKGKVFYRSKFKYVGNLSNGLEDGNGRLFNAKGIIVFDGMWVRGLGYVIESPKDAAATDETGAGREKGVVSGVAPDVKIEEGVVTEGTAWNGNGDYYEGHFRNGMRDGFGKTIFANGNVFIGYWKENVIEGIGTLTTTKHWRYEGMWKNNFLEGKGTSRDNEGVYNGDFVKGKRHGNGELQMGDGLVFVGKFENGERNGFGVMTDKGVKISEGVWKHDKFVAKD